MNFLKTLGLGVYYRVRRISKAFKNWKKFGVVIFGALFLTASILPSQVLQAQAASTDVLRVTLPVASATIKLGQTEDYTIVANVKLNGNQVSPDSVKWYVDSAEQSGVRNQQNFAYTPTAANTNPGYLIRVLVTVGSLTANSTSRLYVQDAPQPNNLTVAISPAGTQNVSVGQNLVFTPTVQWNSGAAQAGTLIDWYVNGAKTATLLFTSQYSLPTAVAGVFSVYAVARYNAVTSGHSNSTLVNVATVTPPSQDFLRVTLPVGSATIKLGQTEDYTIVSNVKLNGNAATPDSVKWYVDSAEQSGARNQQNFAYTPTAVNTTPGYLVRVVVTKGTLSAESTSRLYVQDVDKNLVIAIEPVGTVLGTPNQPVIFTPHVTWNSGPAQAGTTVSWFVNGSQQTILPYTSQFSFTSATAGVFSVYAIAHYSGVDSNHSNTTLVNIPQPQVTWNVQINEPGDTLTLVNNYASKQFSFTARYTSGPLSGSIFTPTSHNWSGTGVGTIDPQTGFYSATAAGTAMITIMAWDSAQHSESANLTFSVVANNPTVRQLATVGIEPLVYGPVLSGTAVNYRAHGYDQFGVELTSSITFNWNVLNSIIGQLNPMTTVYNQPATFATYGWAASGAYYPVNFTANYIATDGSHWTVTNQQLPQLILTQVAPQDVLSYVTAMANPTTIVVGGQTSTLTAQAYGTSGPLDSNVNYVWQKLSGPTYFISNSFSQTVQIASDSNQGLATYQVTATYSGDSTSKTATVQVNVVPVSNHTLTVNITPDPIYGAVNTNVAAYATVLYDGTNVSNSVSINWTGLNANAGYLFSESQANAVWHTGNILGTYPSALQAYTTYNGLSATDLATVVVSAQPAPVYWLDWTLNGVIEDGSTPSEGDIIVYTLTLTNNRQDTVNNIHVNLDVPVNTTFVSATSLTDHPNIYGRTVTWDAGTLSFGQSANMVMRVAINSGLPRRTTSITAYGRVTADQIAGFNIQSNTIRVLGNGPTPGPLPPTGMDTWTLISLAVISLMLAGGVYFWLNRRMARRI